MFGNGLKQPSRLIAANVVLRSLKPKYKTTAARFPSVIPKTSSPKSHHSRSGCSGFPFLPSFRFCLSLLGLLRFCSQALPAMHEKGSWLSPSWAVWRRQCQNWGSTGRGSGVLVFGNKRDDYGIQKRAALAMFTTSNQVFVNDNHSATTWLMRWVKIRSTLQIGR